MKDFIINNWKNLVEIIVSLVLGFLGGITFTNIKNKNKAKVKGNGNIVIQEGNKYNE